MISNVLQRHGVKPPQIRLALNHWFQPPASVGLTCPKLAQQSDKDASRCLRVVCPQRTTADSH